MTKSTVRKITALPPSFKRQLVTILMILVIVMTITTSALTAWQSSKAISKATIENGLQISSNFAEQTVLTLLTGSFENGKEAIGRVLGFKAVDAVAIYQENGELLLLSEGMAIDTIKGKLNTLTNTPQLVIDADDFWIFSAQVTFNDEETDEEMAFPREEKPEQQVLGYVFVQYNKTALHQIQEDIFNNNTLTGTIIAIVLAFIMQAIIKHMVTPLQTLSETMQHAGDTGQYPKAAVSGARELRQIALAYNQMMTILERQNKELEESHDTLESQVEIRTQELIVARDSAMTASRHKSEFLATMSHELRTPLQAIIGYNDLVREDLELECMDDQVKDLNRSIRSANNLLVLINNILDIAKIEAGRSDVNLKPVNMNALVNEAIDTVTPMAQSNENQLHIEVASELPTMQVDRQKLLQIFLNLLSNACKFTKNGQVTFRLSFDEHFLYFDIADTGVGIPEDKLDYIFEHFTQVDGSQARKFEGTGLGMAITRSFVQLMGGEISVVSELMQGSTFSVKLPLKNDG